MKIIQEKKKNKSALGPNGLSPVFPDPCNPKAVERFNKGFANGGESGVASSGESSGGEGGGMGESIELQSTFDAHLFESYFTEAKTTWTPAEIKDLLLTRDDFLGRSLVKLFELQTAAEQESGMTHELNGQGFNSFDADFLSSLARQFMHSDKPEELRLSPRQKEAARKRIMKYAGQLAMIANALHKNDDVAPVQENDGQLLTEDKMSDDLKDALAQSYFEYNNGVYYPENISKTDWKIICAKLLGIPMKSMPERAYPNIKIELTPDGKPARIKIADLGVLMTPELEKRSIIAMVPARQLGYNRFNINKPADTKELYDIVVNSFNKVADLDLETSLGTLHNDLFDTDKRPAIKSYSNIMASELDGLRFEDIMNILKTAPKNAEIYGVIDSINDNPVKIVKAAENGKWDLKGTHLPSRTEELRWTIDGNAVNEFKLANILSGKDRNFVLK